MAIGSRRKIILALAVATLVLLIYGTLQYPAYLGPTDIPTTLEDLWKPVNTSFPPHEQPIYPTSHPTANPYEPALFLRGPPTRHFRGEQRSPHLLRPLTVEFLDNLRSEMQYVTTW